MYSVLDYGLMATDPVRMDAYARAIARTVKPGAIVADLGAGTGIFSLLAARAGAARVHAIDINPAVWVAQDLAAENGLADRIVVHEASSLDVTLPEPVDVIVSDMRGSFPLHHDHVAALHDAATRLLKPGGTLLPTRDRFMAGLVESDGLWSHLERGWTVFERRGLSASSARSATLNSAYSDFDRPLLANHLLTPGEPWLTVSYGASPPASTEGTVSLGVKRGGVAHAIAIWFEATILDDIGYDNAPGVSSAYARRVLPLTEPTTVDAGDRIELTIRADVRGDRWAWDTTIASASGTVKQRLRQSTFLGMPTSPASILRRSSAFRPELSSKGQRATRALGLMDGSTSVADIAATLDGVKPGSAKLESVEEIRDLVSRYGR